MFVSRRAGSSGRVIITHTYIKGLAHKWASPFSLCLQDALELFFVNDESQEGSFAQQGFANLFVFYIANFT